jgi:YidC/Oxa1 family membrane protein insertase
MSQMNNKEHESSNRGMFLAIGLSIAFYVGWNQYLSKKYPNYNKSAPQTHTLQPTGNTNEAGTSPTDSSISSHPLTTPLQPATVATAVVPLLSPDQLAFDSDVSHWEFDQTLGSPRTVRLKKYRSDIDPNSPAVELLHSPFVLTARSADSKEPNLSPYGAVRQGTELTFKRQDGAFLVEQIWSLPAKDSYSGHLSIKFTNTTAAPASLEPHISFLMGAATQRNSSSFFAPGTPGDQPRFLTQAEGSDDFHPIEKFCSDQTKVVAAMNRKLDFFGLDHHYFAAALIPSFAADYATSFVSNKDGICKISTAISKLSLGTIAPNQSADLKFDYWFGPKDDELLTDYNPRLRTTLGLGWLDMIAHPLLLAIKGLYKFSGNYGIAIILLTLLLKILFYPLAKQAAVSAAAMKKHNPEMARIREKYKSEPQKMQMEIMKFMSQHKINPMKGCLPILPTIPVFFALFRVLSASIDLRHAPFYGWIFDLSAKDPYFVTPIILTGAMFVQQKLTPMTGMDPTQEKIMTFMPLIFGVMMISLPSGLVLYMLTNTLFSIAQQRYLNKTLTV